MIKIVKHRMDGTITPNRLWAAWQVSKSWRLQRRLPRLTLLGKLVGMIKA